MLIAAFGLNVSLIVTFVLLLATLVLLTIGDLQGGPEGPVALYVKVGGYVDLATATAAWYVTAADVINDAFGGTVFPLERVGKRTVNLYWVAIEKGKEKR